MECYHYFSIIKQKHTHHQRQIMAACMQQQPEKRVAKRTKNKGINKGGIVGAVNGQIVVHIRWARNGTAAAAADEA
jgi:hypothetical protein